VILLALSCFLALYNNLINLWPSFRRGLYVPCNVALSIALIGIAYGPLGLSMAELGLRPSRSSITSWFAYPWEQR
jgi:hypothetical protein